jgi:hydroxymethylpyrimidine/phosphomethylpyrimidine kinase
VDHRLVSEQIRVVFDSFGPIPTKIGLVPTVDCMDSIAGCLDLMDGQTVVLDPVGASSATPDHSFNQPLVLAEKLFPLASLVTPNIPEAEALLDCRIRSVDDSVSAARRIHSRYGCWVLLKGGHLRDAKYSTDVLFTGKDSFLLPAPRASVSSIHGSGCFLSASITAFSALGFDLLTAVRMAKDHVSKAFSDPVDVGGFPLLYSRP